MRGQPPRLQHPQIGRHLVARLQEHDVAGNKVRAVHRHPLTIAQNGGAGCQHPPDRGHRRLGLVFLDEADHRIGKHHGEDHPGIHPVLQGPRHHCRTDQDVDQHVVELPQKAHHRPPRPHFRQAVRPMLDQSPHGLGRGQALGCCVKGQEAVIGRCGVWVGRALVIAPYSHRR